MHASKVYISQRTRALLDNQMLSKKKKRQLRVQAVKEYINSQAPGTKIQLSDLIAAAGYMNVISQTTSYWRASSFINTLIKNGTIIKLQPSKRKSEYVVGVKTPKLQARVEVVEGDGPELNDKAYVVKSDDVSKPTGQDYSFELTFSKRGKSGDFGRIRMAQLEMTDVELQTARKMINELMDNIT